jgi:hypothetical protein
MKAATIIIALLLSSTSIATVPNPPAPLCIDDKCPATDEPSTIGIKWNPGHYMLVFRGDSHDVVMSKRIPEVCAEPALQGMQLRADWPDLESAKGQYNFLELDQIYAALAACGKRLVVEVWAVEFNTTSTSGIVPSYILTGAEYNGGVAKTSGGYIARLWEAPVMDRLIALYRAMAERYDTKPYFEAIVFTETATSGVADGYTATAWVAQLKRALVAMNSAWSSTNVVIFNNFIQGATDSQLADIFASLHSNRAGTGAPDVLPPPHTPNGEAIYRGESGGTDYRGKIPAMFAVQTPELGGKEGTYTPKQLYDHCVGTNACSHMFWIRNTLNGGSAQMWDTGILPFLRSNPPTRESCPSNYPGCVN